MDRQIAAWQGRGSKTLGFLSESGRLRVTWKTRNEQPETDGTFHLTLHSAVSGRLLHVIAEHRGPGGATVEVDDDPRPFNFMVEAAGVEWSISVDEIVASAPATRRGDLRPSAPDRRPTGMFEPLLLALVFAQSGAQSAPAVIQPDAEVLQGEWDVEVIDNIEVMPDSRVTVRFQGTRVTGMASCNSYQGTADIQGTALTFRGILATMKFCDGPRMSQERDFLELLRTAVRYELRPDGVLAIANAGGKTITARRKRAT